MHATSLKIVVTSFNPVKIEAVRQAFASQFPAFVTEVVPLNVDSGVADQPMSDAETLLGARNRVASARLNIPGADYWVGLEGGLDYFDGYLMAFAWMAVAGPGGRSSETRSVTLPLPPQVQALVEDGLELGEANDRVFSILNSKQAGGAYGLLTGGAMTRESIYTQTLILALIPFVHELWS
ncbi:MAG: inosine/xanthosine triphosphatase [Lysobacterales bacterium]